jgi:hypothetical protein
MLVALGLFNLNLLVYEVDIVKGWNTLSKYFFWTRSKCLCYRWEWLEKHLEIIFFQFPNIASTFLDVIPILSNFDFLRTEMVGQRRHFAEIKNPEKFWNSRWGGFFSSCEISKKGTRKVSQRSQDIVAGKEMHFQVTISLQYRRLFFIWLRLSCNIIFSVFPIQSLCNYNNKKVCSVLCFSRNQ